MINIVTILSTALDSAKRRIPKFLRYGKSDVQTSLESAPFGIDGNPIKNTKAIYLNTSEKGKDVIVGYINKNQKALSGELRLYSLDSEGNEKTFLHLKNDGTIEINDNLDFAVKYNALNSGLSNYNTLLLEELIKIQTAIGSVGGNYTANINLDFDISSAKVNSVKM